VTALHAEWTKLRTVAGPGWLLLAAIMLTVAVGALAANAVTCPAGGCQVDPAKVSLAGIYVGQTIVAILATAAVSGEYSTGMIRLTLTATPRRWLVLAAKTTVVGTATLATGAVAVLASVLAGRMLLTSMASTRRTATRPCLWPTGRSCAPPPGRRCTSR
jgi:ABC-2 type transport system permease protein